MTSQLVDSVCVCVCVSVCVLVRIRPLQNLNQLPAPSVEPVKHNEGIKRFFCVFFCLAFAFHHCQIKK